MQTPRERMVCSMEFPRYLKCSRAGAAGLRRWDSAFNGWRPGRIWVRWTGVQVVYLAAVGRQKWVEGVRRRGGPLSQGDALDCKELLSVERLVEGRGCCP